MNKYPGVSNTPFEEIVEFAERLLDKIRVSKPAGYHLIMLPLLRSIYDEMTGEMEEANNEH